MTEQHRDVTYTWNVDRAPWHQLIGRGVTITTPGDVPERGMVVSVGAHHVFLVRGDGLMWRVHLLMSSRVTAVVPREGWPGVPELDRHNDDPLVPEGARS